VYTSLQDSSRVCWNLPVMRISVSGEIQVIKLQQSNISLLMVDPYIYTGDLTCLVTLEESHELEARLSSREDFVTAGLAILPEAIKVMCSPKALIRTIAKLIRTIEKSRPQIFAPDVRMEQKVTDGTAVPKVRPKLFRISQLGSLAARCVDPPHPQGTVLATLKGPSHQLLRLERTVLNTVSRLSGIATRTRSADLRPPNLPSPSSPDPPPRRALAGAPERPRRAHGVAITARIGARVRTDDDRRARIPPPTPHKAGAVIGLSGMRIGAIILLDRRDHPPRLPSSIAAIAILGRDHRP
jgi:hypothetical protein